MFNYKNKNVIITGGGSGIGKAMACIFAEYGAIVHIIELNEDAGISTVQQIIKNGGEAYMHIVDISKFDSVNKTFKGIAQKYGVQILINNAGIAHVGNIENTAEKDLDRLYSVNVKGVYNCIHAVISYMKEHKEGIILNMASIASSVGLSDRFAYSMTKGAVLTMTYSVAKDYISDGIRCNCISPGRVHTPFVDSFIKKNYPGKEKEMFGKLSKTQPIGRMGQPEEIAKLALFLCSDDASFITGTNFPIDGGFVKLQG